MNDQPKRDIRKRFGIAVRTSRENLQISQEDFADLAGLHRTYISDLERGKRNISLRNIERLAMALNLSISELMQRVDDQ